MAKNRKIIIGITAPPSVDLIVGQLDYLKSKGFEVALLAPQDERVNDYCNKEGVRLIPIEIERSISIIKDIKTIIKLIKIFYTERPDIINLGTPKVSLLGMIAGKFTRVPYRIYTCRGFRFEHETGKFRTLLITLEKITASCAHKVFCISKSVKDLGIELDIFPSNKTRLIAHGSSNGVDLELFNPVQIKPEKITALKQNLSLGKSFVYGFVGRLVDRKGLKELYTAFTEVYEQDKNCKLIVVGRPFWDQISDSTIINKFNSHPGIIMTGFQPLEDIPCYLSLMDTFLLPAHWEGFGNVLIQASALGVAIVATNVTGVKDAVSDGFNGILVNPDDKRALVSAMLEMKMNDSLRSEMGKNGIEWSKNFEPSIIWQGYVDLYNEPI
jgi:glycosyltransferase involved in cell wall biosynthesis